MSDDKYQRPNQANTFPSGYGFAVPPLSRGPVSDFDQYLQMTDPAAYQQYQANSFTADFMPLHQYTPPNRDASPPHDAGASQDSEGDTDEDPVQYVRQRRQQKGERQVARVEGSKPRSKRAELRAKILEEHGSVSAVDMPRGQTRKRRGGIKEWYDPKEKSWKLAAPLDDYRHRIIQEDNAGETYDHLPICGLHEDDITTFPRNDLLGQKAWNFDDRTSFGNITDEEGNEVLYLVYPPETNIKKPKPGYMMYNNTIMLDPDDHPIIDWPGIPRCFSSNIEGGRIEALRRVYPWLSMTQFRARMPRTVQCKLAGVKPLYGMSTFSQRLCRFRGVMDIPPWMNRSKGADMLPHTMARLAEEGLEPTSTAGLQPLSREDVLKRKQKHKGKFPENHGLYTLSTEQRQQKEARDAKRLRDNKLKREAPASFDQPSIKRQRSASSAGVQPSLPWLQTPTSGLTTTPSDPTASTHNLPNELNKFSEEGPGFSNLENVQLGFSDNMDLDWGLNGDFTHPPNQDLRDVAPQTISEQLAIRSALSFTIADYHYWYKLEPPPTSNNLSYSSQYNEIQQYHHDIWTSVFEIEVPQLVSISAWYGSFKSVPTPDVSEEVMKRLLQSDEIDDNSNAEPSTEATFGGSVQPTA